MLEARIRNRLDPAQLENLDGKLPAPNCYDLLLTGPTRLLKPDGRPLAVYLPGVMTAEVDAAGVYEVLHSLWKEIGPTTNRGKASGTPRFQSHQNRSYSRKVPSAIIGAVDPAGQQKYCPADRLDGEEPAVVGAAAAAAARHRQAARS